MFTQAIVGGILIGLAAAWMYLSLGRIAGISGIVGQALRDPSGLWQVAFIIGLGIGGLGVMLQMAPAEKLDVGTGALVIAGLVVGFGTRLGSGCTSGHGVCGIARLSKRSIIATCVFVATGMVAATGLRAAGVL